MNRQNAIALGIAVVIGLVAVYLLNVFLSGTQQKQEAAARQAQMTKIAVAARTIDFSTRLTNTNVVLADWPTANVPPGAFTSVNEATHNRVALERIAVGEPILAGRVSGPNGKAGLSGTLPVDKVAVAIPVNEVTGVGGFARPGDVVDVILTRQIPGPGATQSDRMSDVVLQAVPVLAVDQVFDKSKSDPALAKTATLQVDPVGAQKLALARELGTLSLALRNIVAPSGPIAGTITARDLGGVGFRLNRPVLAAAEPATAAPPSPRPPAARPPAIDRPVVPRYFGPTMTIYRKGKPTEYEVNHAF